MLLSEFMNKLPEATYLYPCKTGGNCRKELFEQHGVEWLDSFRTHGNITLMRREPVTATHLYKCCTQCHLPINHDEAIRANNFLGLSLQNQPVEDDDLDFLELLNEQ